MKLQSDDAHAPYTSMAEGEESSSFGTPVFPPLMEVKLGPVKKSWVTTTFYETVVTVESASKLLCLPKQSHRRVIRDSSQSTSSPPPRSRTAQIKDT